MNNLNCHVEPKRQLRAETSQPLHISPRDIAEDAKLNHEIAKELRRYTPASLVLKGSKFSSKLALNRKRMGLNKTLCLLTLFTLLPTLAHAETCTPTPDCKSLGYTETSCPDGGGVKCPWNTNLMYCPKYEIKDLCQGCEVGMILNSDMTCSKDRENGKVPIGVVAIQAITNLEDVKKCVGLAIALKRTWSYSKWDDAYDTSNEYEADGVKGWRLPTKEELLTISENIDKVQTALKEAGEKQLKNAYWWSSSFYLNTSGNHFWVVNPIDDDTYYSYYGNTYDFRPVLAF